MLQVLARNVTSVSTLSPHRVVDCLHKVARFGVAPSAGSTNGQASRPQSPLLRPLDINITVSRSDLIPSLESRQPGPDSLRTGLIAVKVGMLSEWDEYGVLTPLTVLWFDDNQVRLYHVIAL